MYGVQMREGKQSQQQHRSKTKTQDEDKPGHGRGRGTLFLPQLLNSSSLDGASFCKVIDSLPEFRVP